MSHARTQTFLFTLLFQYVNVNSINQTGNIAELMIINEVPENDENDTDTWHQATTNVIGGEILRIPGLKRWIPMWQTTAMEEISQSALQYDNDYGLPRDMWPAMSYIIPTATSLFHSAPPSTTTRSITVRFSQYHFRPRPTMQFLSSKHTLKRIAMGFATPRPTLPSKNFMRKNFPLTPPPTWFAVYRTMPYLSEKNRNKKDFQAKLTLKDGAIMTEIALIENSKVLDHTANTYYDIHKQAFGITDGEGDDETKPLKAYLRGAETTTTTTTTTRTYPYSQWICYECGRNETKFGSPFCHNVFEAQSRKENSRKHSLRYRCNGHRSVVYGCFKRFLDIGHYNERGCRNWPPRRSGKTYASKRLRVLERALWDVRDGCIMSPQASLVSFSRTVQLYVRFHVCVCHGTLCNGASCGPWLVVLLMSVFGAIYNIFLHYDS